MCITKCNIIAKYFQYVISKGQRANLCPKTVTELPTMYCIFAMPIMLIVYKDLIQRGVSKGLVQSSPAF